ncbi:hypothetical protein ACJX0J_039907, partial [Zea mays]
AMSYGYIGMEGATPFRYNKVMCIYYYTICLYVNTKNRIIHTFISLSSLLPVNGLIASSNNYVSVPEIHRYPWNSIFNIKILLKLQVFNQYLMQFLVQGLRELTSLTIQL